MYHYVRDREDTPEADIRGLSTAEFQGQLDALCELMTPIDWPSMLAWRAGRRKLDSDAFLLTFDDGLSDHADVVAPILESRGLRGVFFVPTAPLVEATLSPAHQMHILLCKLGPAKLMEDVRARLLADDRPESLESERNRNNAREFYAYETPERAELKYLLTFRLPMDYRRRLVNELFEKHVGDARECATRWYLNWEQIARMQSVGHAVGGHGHDHEPYLRLNPAEQARDMVRCAAILQEGLGPGARPFSYPYGSCDSDVARRCAFAGFVNGFTTQSGWVLPSTDAHLLGRVDTVDVGAFFEREFTCTVP